MGNPWRWMWIQGKRGCRTCTVRVGRLQPPGKSRSGRPQAAEAAPTSHTSSIHRSAFGLSQFGEGGASRCPMGELGSRWPTARMSTKTPPTGVEPTPRYPGRWGRRPEWREHRSGEQGLPGASHARRTRWRAANRAAIGRGRPHQQRAEHRHGDDVGGEGSTATGQPLVTEDGGVPTTPPPRMARWGRLEAADGPCRAGPAGSRRQAHA